MYQVISKYLAVLLVVWALHFKLSLAETNFDAEYNIVYDIAQNGETTVTNHVTITNLKDDILAAAYTFGLSQMDAYAVTAGDSSGKLEVIATNEPEHISIDVKLSKYAIGAGSKNSFYFTYKSNQIAVKTGQIWNINIPKYQNNEEKMKYSVTLRIPEDFGPKVFLTPQTDLHQITEGKNVYIFNYELIKNAAIAASFGSKQILNFKLTYQLENTNKFSTNYDIALPPTIVNKQLVSYENISVKPQRRYVDKDGNYLATFRLKPNTKLAVVLIGSVQLASEQIDNFQSTSSQIEQSKINNKYKIYTKKQQYWDIDSDIVQEIAKNLADPKASNITNAFKIYNYLIANYSYDFGISKKDYVARKGGANALLDKSQWGCMEFTDSFISIARAMGIPAREINGYATSTSETLKPISVSLKSGDFLHAWPEFYDPKFGWVQIDPTWGNTSNSDYFSKLDTGHFAFVIKGLNSEYPYPAGMYRTNTQNKLIEVDYSQSEKENTFVPKYTVSKTLNLNLIKVLQHFNKYKITNIGTTFIFLDKEHTIKPGDSAFVYVKKGQTNFKIFDALENSTDVKIT